MQHFLHRMMISLDRENIIRKRCLMDSYSSIRILIFLVSQAVKY